MALAPWPIRAPLVDGTAQPTPVWQRWLSALREAVTGLEAGAAAGGSTGSVTFPATPVPSSDPHVLDDYEEGSWTPTDGSGAGLTLTGSGFYQKVGNQVTIMGVVTYPVTASGATATVGPLPFPSVATATNLRFSVTVGFSTATVPLAGLVLDDATALIFTTTGTPATNAHLSGTTTYFAGSYRAAA